MAGAGDDKRDASRSASADSKAGSKQQRDGESLAARRRRIEMMRERQELMAMLDDYGDGDMELDFELLEEDDDVGRWVAAEEGNLDDEEVSEEDLDEDDDYFDEDFEDDD